MKTWTKMLCAAALALLLPTLPTLVDTAALAAELKVGSTMDLSGPTSSVGQPYAKGIRDCVAWLNANGGVAGNTITLVEVDDAYNVQQGMAAYKRFVAQEKVVAVQGFGTAIVEALVKFAAKDQIPFFSASYSAHLADPASAPYNFFIAADYSTQLRAALKYFKDQWKEARAPKLAFTYPDAPYGLVPIAAGKQFAKELGFEVVGDETVDLKAIDATTQLLSLQKKAPDYTWIGGTTPSAAVMMKDAQKVGVKTTFFTNIWGSDENIFKLAGPAAEGGYSLQAAAVYGQDVPGMKVIQEVTKGEPQMTHYVRGFTSMLVLAEGIKKAAAKGKVDGQSIKEALETLRDFDPMGLTPAISYFPDDHRPSMAVFLYKMTGGKLVFAAKQELPRDKAWLGK